MAVNGNLNADNSYNSYELLAWLNETLQTGFTKMEQLCSGAAHCQLMDYMFPGSVDLSRVRFLNNNMVDSIHNYSLLQGAFRKVGIVRHIPMEALMKKNTDVALTFLRWFKRFFDENDNGREYDALQARGGQKMVPDEGDDVFGDVLQSKDDSSSKMEVTVKTEGKTANRNADVIVLTSDDDDDDDVVVEVTMEEKMETTLKEQSEKMLQIVRDTAPFAISCNSDTKTETTMKEQSVETPPTVKDAAPVTTSRNSGTLLCFIRKYCQDQANGNTNFSTSTDTQVDAILSPTYLTDTIQACSNTPYCLYLFTGVELDAGHSTSVVLVGYHNQSSGLGVVRLLDALQTSVDTVGPQTSADVDADAVSATHAADSDACLLVKTLRKFELSLSNISSFYCNAAHPRASQVFVSQLQAFNPRLVSLCGLPGMAGRACQAGLLASFSCVIDLIRDIHNHYSTCPSINDSLKALFAGADVFRPSDSVSAQCLFIIRTVQKMVGSWKDLVEYFKSLRPSMDTIRIRNQLMDAKVQLQFLFLSHALEPLRALQELQQYNAADVAVELQLTSVLVHTYATSLLRPSVAERFLRRRDLALLHSKKEHLPATEVNIGYSATNFMRCTAGMSLKEKQRADFLKEAVDFYKVALQSLTESIPEKLGHEALRNICVVLKHPENINGSNMSRHVLSDLGIQLGLCSPGSSQAYQLTFDYLTFIKKVKEQQERGTEGNHCWAKVMNDTKPHSLLHQLLLTLLALPSSLNRNEVFDKVFNRVKAASESSKETPEPSPQSARWTGRPRVRRRKLPVRTRRNGKKKYEESSTDDSDSDVSEDKPTGLQMPPVDFRDTEDSDYTDNSSDVVDVTEESKLSRTRRLIKTEPQITPQAESIYVVGSDGGDDDDEEEDMDSTATPTNSAELHVKSDDVCGQLVWGQVEGFSLWPAIIIPYTGESQVPGKRMVRWYGQTMLSLVSDEALKPFSDFSQHYCAKSFAILVTYREAIFLSLQEAALRCKKKFPACPEDRDELLKKMLDWAFGGFKPTGPDGLKPVASMNGVTKTNNKPNAKKNLFPKASPHSSVSTSGKSNNISVELKEVAVSLNKLSCNSIEKSSNRGGAEKTVWEEQSEAVKGVKGDAAKEKGARGGWSAAETGKRVKGGWEVAEKEKDDWGGGWGKGRRKGGKKKKSGLFDGFDDDMSPDFVPRKRAYAKTYNKVNRLTSVYTQPDQKLREETIRRIMDMKLDIDGFCLCCGTENVEIFHPLFKGSLCLKCKDNFSETLYRYDEDGYQSYCTICCYGMEVILCGNDSCCRSFCEDCLNILVGAGTFDSLKVLDPWICYLCQPHQPHGALIPREDWSIRVQELFANNSAIAFEPHRVYPSIPANLRRPIRVLSLFDGIATGYLVLKDLGFKVEKYVASEVCEDSIAVATINHDGKIIHVGDVRFVTEEHLDQWGPFDLLIGGSPCNDLSIVNPIRKGLYEGTGRLFFEFYRILQLLKPKEEEPRPFFWLFENVVFMNTHDKVNICRFLECNPVLVDAVKVSPAHRARYFWGNIPGMSRPIAASQKDKLSLQDCLELGREARVTKVRTITTNPNSLKQGKDVSQLPVLQNGKEDNLWITELEKIFGFPKHYTDVRNMNRQQRQKVLGKAWSVPVIRHLFAPLKDYFACEELLPASTVSSMSTSVSVASTSPSSPASPELQQLR